MITIENTIQFISRFVKQNSYGEDFYVELDLKRYDIPDIEGEVTLNIEGLLFRFVVDKNQVSLYVDGFPYQLEIPLTSEIRSFLDEIILEEKRNIEDLFNSNLITLKKDDI